MNKYALGIDLGTNSIGWALVDEDNKLVEKKKFTLWGVRMFDESKSSKDRRVNRNARRRLKRRRDRINYLQEFFFEEINKIDKNFFQRLNDSFYKQEDKMFSNHYTFFDDEITDRDYFDRFPTIYHLRKYILEHNEKIDIRMLYLSLHHMIKYRGNFLYDGTFNKSDFRLVKNDFEIINTTLCEKAEEYEDDEDFFRGIDLSDELFEKLNQILSANKTKNDKKNELFKLFNPEKKSFVNELLIPLLVGGKVSVNNLSLIKEQKYEKAEISLDSDSLEANIEDAKEKIKELANIFDLILNIKEIYDFYFVCKLIGNCKYLSEAMVIKYDKHQDDLKELKKLVKEFLPKEYNTIFKKVDSKTNNYPKYIGMNHSKKRERFGHCSQEDFYAFIKSSVLNKITEPEAQEVINKIKRDIEDENYLPRQNSGHNTSIPMQLNLIELKEILEKQSKYYDFLNQNDGKYTVKDKIEKIFKYRIPYYVGPLAYYNGSEDLGTNRAWYKRNENMENVKITPWNFEEVVNTDESAKEFIQRMQNKCSYLHGADDYCLPKKSLLYSEYNCMQYLNKLVVNGAPITKDVKMNIFENVFLKKKKPSKKDIYDLLESNYGFKKDSLYSKIEDIPCDMSSYIKFKEIFGDEFEENKEKIEEIIKDITIFEDKKILEKRLKDVYELTDDKIKSIKDLNYKGYGRLCKRLLNGLSTTNNKTGETGLTIIDILRDTNLNLMEILASQEYNFQAQIDEYNKNLLKENKESVEDFINDNLFVSADGTRALNQCYKLIEEIERIIGEPIDSYYIECTRTNKDKKVVKASRKNATLDLLKQAKSDAIELEKFGIDINKLTKDLEASDNDLRGEKLFLYYRQLGRCMYSFEKIDVSKLDNYDIDHIYPQSLIKDDSFSNKVLVNKIYNQHIKKDKFLFEIRDNLDSRVFGFYKLLLDKKLITKEKYRRLTETEISSEKLNGFVNRQLVSTNQAVKGLITLLKEYKGIDPSKIIYSKSENVSDFRKDYDIEKSRDANNFHHAHDAYLNVVIGRTIDRYYKHNHLYYFDNYQEMKNDKKTINPQTILKNDRVYNTKNGLITIWEKEKTLKLLNHYIKETYSISETWRTSRGTEMYGKMTVRPASDTRVPVSLTDPRIDVQKYGGIESNAYSHYCIVRTIDKKNKVDYYLEAIPYRSRNNQNEYISNLYSLNKSVKEYKIVCNEIKTKVLVRYGKLAYYITGKTGDSYLIMNAIDRFMTYDAIKTLKSIAKYKENIKYSNPMVIEKNRIIIAKNKDNEITRQITVEECDNLLKQIITVYSKEIYGYSNVSSIVERYKKNTKELSLTDKIELVYQLIQLLKTNARCIIDLSIINGSKNSGLMVITRHLKPGMKFISTSITGYYEKLLFEVPDGI